MAGVTGGQRAKLVYLEHQATFRNQVWEGDHKCLPVLELPPRGRAVTPWVTMFIDDRDPGDDVGHCGGQHLERAAGVGAVPARLVPREWS
ncbi:hypothetical protein [Microbispora bryophytorum]|uniref:hypothetical protein n=1 Tax=Microbispora bryophytorum TaxID=1460882 RepID=UPI00340789C1